MDKNQAILDQLDKLAQAAGIKPDYWDVFGHCNKVSSSTKKSLLSAMELEIDTDDAVVRSLKLLEARNWQLLVQPITVIRHGQPLIVHLSLPLEALSDPVDWCLISEDGHVFSGSCVPKMLAEHSRFNLNGKIVIRLYMTLPININDGYHTITVATKNNTISAKGSLVVAPVTSYLPNWFLTDEHRWGIACHLYALRSEHDWGIGDFTTLAKLADIISGTGATCLGINPLHTLFLHEPLHCSPYSPSSRLFLNPLYIDVSVVPEFLECDKARKYVKASQFQKRLSQVRNATHVDYMGVTELKNTVLKLLHECFETKHPQNRRTDGRRKAFIHFCEEGGEQLRQFALHQAITDAYNGLRWHDWPLSLQAVNSVEVQRFSVDTANSKAIAYHLYLQWEADRQLGVAAQRCTNNGLSTGLYRDLAVGIDPAGADAWSRKESFATAYIGAPPDQFNDKGQNWGSPPFNPLKLKDSGYSDFINVLRANMRHAGALRIDHVMALMRLFWIPAGGDPLTGAYVQYPFDDLLGIIALESHRHKCMIIGEDLGTVPDSLRERMASEGILSYRVLMFERWKETNFFKRPHTYPSVALATASTHDLPTVVGYWEGSDIFLKKTLNLIQTDESEMRRNRAVDRLLLRAALMDQRLINEDFPLDPELNEENLQILVLAVHRFLANSNSRFMLVNLYDLLLENNQINVPGTVDEYQNWRCRMSQTVEALRSDSYLMHSLARIYSDRQSIRKCT